jgi:hypothetical protein
MKERAGVNRAQVQCGLWIPQGGVLHDVLSSSRSRRVEVDEKELPLPVHESGSVIYIK